MDTDYSRSYHFSPIAKGPSAALVPTLPWFDCSLFLWFQKLHQYQCLSNNRFLSIPLPHVSQSEVVVVVSK